MIRPLITFAAALAALGAVFLWAESAAGAAQCGERDKMIAMLSQKYKEAPIALGVTYSGGLVEVLTTGDGRTWSIIVTTPQGMTCLVAVGEGWRSKEFQTEDPKA